MKISKHIGLTILTLTMFTGCSDDDKKSLITGNGTVSLTVSGLEATAGQHYEGWLITTNGPVSTGRFNINGSGNIDIVDVTGAVQSSTTSTTSDFSYAENGNKISAFVLTIEPNGDSDPAPSNVHYVGGNFSASTRAVTAVTSDVSAIGADFTGASGSYILATPTNGAATHNQGIWFLSAGQPSLDIPDLTNTGWAYEGWVVGSGGPVSTGIFFTASGVDSDGPGAGAGVMAAPSFPGQDFISPARILNDGTYTTVISIEPYPDTDPAPFTVKILNDMIDLNEATETSVNLTNFSNEEAVTVTATLPE